MFTSCPNSFRDCWGISVGRDQLDFEDEGGAAGDAGLVVASVGLLGGDVDFPLVAGVHLLHGYDPSGNEIAESECGGHTAAAAVECLSVDGLAGVVDGNDARKRRRGERRIALADYFIKQALVERKHAGLT